MGVDGVLFFCTSVRTRIRGLHDQYCTWFAVPELPLWLSWSPGEADSEDWEGVECNVERGVASTDLDECKLLVSKSSSASDPWWHKTRSTKSSFSRQVSVGIFLSIRYCRRSFTFSLISCGLWKAVSFSTLHVEHLQRFSCRAEQREQKFFLQSQQTCFEKQKSVPSLENKLNVNLALEVK